MSPWLMTDPACVTPKQACMGLQLTLCMYVSFSVVDVINDINEPFYTLKSVLQNDRLFIVLCFRRRTLLSPVAPS